MYKTIIRLNDNVSEEQLYILSQVIEKAFVNRAGSLKNVSTHSHEFIFQGDEAFYGCLNLGMFSLRRQKGFLDYIKAMEWVDEDPDESCNMLDVFARHPI